MRPSHPRPTLLAEVKSSDPTPGNIFAKRVIGAVLCAVGIFCFAQVTFIVLQAGWGR